MTEPRRSLPGLPVHDLPLHALPVGRAGLLGLPAGDEGIIVGADPAGAPVVLQPFRPRPVDIVIVGPVPLAATIALRALAVGATVVVETPRPQAWASAGRRLFPLVPLGGTSDYSARVDAPLLVVSEALMRAQSLAETSAWTARLLLLPSVHDALLPLIARADLVVSAQLRADSAATLAHALSLAEPFATTLTELAPYTCLWAADGTVQMVSTRPTETEQHTLRDYLPGGGQHTASSPPGPAPSAPPARAPSAPPAG